MIIFFQITSLQTTSRKKSDKDCVNELEIITKLPTVTGKKYEVTGWTKGNSIDRDP